MQLKIWSPWKIITVCAFVGVLGAAVFSMTVPDRYVSTAVIRVGEGSAAVHAGVESVLSRSSLTGLINQQDLYKDERARLPLEEIVARMKGRDIRIAAINTKDGRLGAISVSFTGPDAERTRRVTDALASALVNANAGTILDPASLPSFPQNPRRSRIIFMGLLAGILSGTAFALFYGLKVTKLAAALGVAGLIVGVGIAFALPDQYASTTVLRYVASDQAAAGARVHKLIEAATSDASLRAVVQKFDLYSNDAGAERKLRENLRIETIANSSAFMIQFHYPDRETAQKVTAYLVGALLDGAIFDGNRNAESRMTLELLDPPVVPLKPYFPNRPMVAGTGFVVGLLLAIGIGLWRCYRVPLQLVAS